jgi:type IV secretory pathway TrbD component
MSKILSLIAGLIAAGIGFVILYPILGVTLWVAFLVAACLLVVFSVSSTRVTAH